MPGGIDPNQPAPSDGGGYGGGGDWASAAINLGTAIYTSQAQKKAQERQNEANKALAKYQYDLNQEAWMAQNLYNDPSSQAERLRNAGLNPALMYGGGGGSSSGNASDYPKYNAPRMEQEFSSIAAAQLPTIISQFQEFRMRQAQIDNVRANTANIETRTVSDALRPDLLKTEQQTKDFDLDTKSMMRPYQATIGEESSRQSKAKTLQEWQKLELMKQQEQSNLLKQQQQKSGITGQQLTNELRYSQIIFQRYRNEWTKQGITSSDNPLLRIFVRQLNEAGILDSFSPKDITDFFKP